MDWRDFYKAVLESSKLVEAEEVEIDEARIKREAKITGLHSLGHINQRSKELKREAKQLQKEIIKGMVEGDLGKLQARGLVKRKKEKDRKALQFRKYVLDKQMERAK